MASALFVQLAKPILLTDVLRLAESVVPDLLRSKMSVRLSADLLSKGHRSTPPRVPIDAGDVFLIKSDSPNAEVSLVLSPTFQDGDQAGRAPLDAGVSVSSATTTFEYALAAAVALALGKLADSNIIDDNEFWNSKYEQSADDFLETVRLKADTQSIQDGADRFVRQMNKR